MQKIQLLSRFFFITLALCLFLYVVIHNINPLGITQSIMVTGDSSDTTFLPKDRISVIQSNSGELVTNVTNDLIYFNTNMPYSYDTAKVKIRFKNPNKNQAMFIGFQDDEIWHYSLQQIDNSILNNLIDQGWTKIDGNPTLYQRDQTYTSYDNFLQSIPDSEVVGLNNYDQNIFQQTTIPNYAPENTNTIIEQPLRGNVSFFVYVENEPFKLKITKQDLNMYPDPDTVTVKIYKENDVVYSVKIDDDGITDSSNTSLGPQETLIQNPGPEYPEPGVYKVVIEGSSDTVITKIETNLHKIVFLSPIYPVTNHDVYPQIMKQNRPTKVFTDASLIKATTQHQVSEQTISIGTQSAELKLNEEFIATPSASENLTEINIPKSDILLRATHGYFLFDPKQYFSPTRIKLQNIYTPDDVTNLNYIISNYHSSSQENGWQVAESYFDLKTAFIKKGKLSWILKVPGLKDNNNTIIIKDIEVSLTKKPLI